MSDVKVQKAKEQPSKKQAPSTLPIPEIDDPTDFEPFQVNFDDVNETNFLLRQKLKAKLIAKFRVPKTIKINGKDTEVLDPIATSKNAAEHGVMCPIDTPYEAATKRKYLELISLAASPNEADQLRVELLKKKYYAKSLLNLAAALARSELAQEEKNDIKQWFDPAAKDAKDKYAAQRKARY